jgi:NADH-quinone oxidoreductase subunit J
LAAIVGVLIALEMAAVLMGGFRVSEEPHVVAILGQVPLEISNSRELGKLLFTHYLYPIEVAAGILLVAMIAAIALTLRQRKDSKYVSPSDQVRVKAKDRMVVVKMDATKMAIPDDASIVPTAEKTV